jgi:hypothetical protein
LIREAHILIWDVRLSLFRKEKKMNTECIRFVRTQCEFLAASYHEAQEVLLSRILTNTGEDLIPLGSHVAAYDLALCSLQRLTDIAVNCSYERLPEELALRMLLDGLTREVLFLGGAEGQVYGQDAFAGKPGADVQHYHQAQAEVLRAVLHDIETMLSPVLIAYVTLFMEPAQIQVLDAQPYWSDTTRRKAVADVCEWLANEGKLDKTYAVIAREVEKIDFPRDIHGEEDRYRRCAVPTYVRRLLVRDLIACIASLKVTCFAAISTAWGVSRSGCVGEVQRLVERHAAEIPVPQRSMWMEIYPQAVPLLGKVGLIAMHPETCLLCRTHDGHCGMWHVTFPDRIDFGEATQTAYDRANCSPIGWGGVLSRQPLSHPREALGQKLVPGCACFLGLKGQRQHQQPRRQAFSRRAPSLRRCGNWRPDLASLVAASLSQDAEAGPFWRRIRQGFPWISRVLSASRSLPVSLKCAIRRRGLSRPLLRRFRS